MLAQLLDCYLACDCCSGEVTCQVLPDKLLHDIDRAIDFYVQGDGADGEPEVRAAAFGPLIAAFLALAQVVRRGTAFGAADDIEGDAAASSRPLPCPS